MRHVTVGQPVPDSTLPATGDQEISLRDFQGKTLVLYFYPRDNTPGCTLEGQAFRDLFSKFKGQGVVILGVSRDSVKSHENFKSRHGLPFDLVSDQDETWCRMFDVMKMKNMYGKQVRGIERSTFLVDKQGVLRREWRKVKVKNHAEEVLQAVMEL